MSRYIRPTFTEPEAKALLALGRSILQAEAVAQQVYASDVEVGMAFKALTKITEAIVRQPGDRADVS